MPGQKQSPKPLSGRSVASAGETTEPVPYAELRRRERDNLLAALRITGWKIYGAGGAAELLGVKPTTLASRIQKMGLKKPD